MSWATCLGLKHLTTRERPCFPTPLTSPVTLSRVQLGLGLHFLVIFL